jgi:hypothetical protein
MKTKVEYGARIYFDAKAFGLDSNEVCYEVYENNKYAYFDARVL